MWLITFFPVPFIYQERGLTLLAPAPLDSIYRISPEMLHGMGLPTNQHLLGEYNMLSIKNYPMDPNYQLQLNHVENASDLEIVHVPEGLTLQEARGLWEAKSKRGMMHIGQCQIEQNEGAVLGLIRGT